MVQDRFNSCPWLNNMELHVLDKTKMEGIRELAGIHEQISTGRANLDLLKTDLEKFIADRELMADQAVRETLEKLQELIKAAVEHGGELALWHNELKDYSDTVRKWLQDINDLYEDFKKWSGVEEKKLENYRKILKDDLVTVKKATVLAKAEREQVDRDKKSLYKLQAQVFSQQKSLKAAFALAREKGII